MTASILVTGATGNVGGALVRRLSAGGVPARGLVRRDVELPAGIDAVRGDLTDAGSLSAALDGVTHVFLVWPNGESTAADDVLRAMAGRRVVYLSTVGATTDPSADPITRMHGELERVVREHAAEWTFLRSGGMATNTLGWADQIRDHRAVRWPYGEAGRPLVHEDDLAAVAQVALTTDDLLGQSPDLTGPKTLTQREQVATIGTVLGEPVEWDELSRDEARAELLGQGWPEATTDGALDAWGAMVDHPDPVSPEVERILGRPATPYADWVRDHADAFR